MIFASQSYSLIFQDAVFSLAIGFVAGFVHQLLGIFLYRGQIKLFIRDVVTGLVFTVLIFSYSVSFANYPILRWYMVLFAVIGLVLFMPRFAGWGNLLVKLQAATAGFFIARRFENLKVKCADIIEKNKEKKQKFTQKNQSEVLKTSDIMLYN